MFILIVYDPSSNNNLTLDNTHSRSVYCVIQMLLYADIGEKIEPTTLSMTDYAKFVESIQDEVAAFLKGQAKGMAQEEQR